MPNNRIVTLMTDPRTAADPVEASSVSDAAAEEKNKRTRPTAEQVAARLHDEHLRLLAANVRLLVDRDELALLLAISPATLDRAVANGRIPPPLNLSGSCVRWRRQEIVLWLAAGAPPAKEWAARQHAQRHGNS